MHKIAVLLLLAGGVRDAHACAPAPHAGETIAVVEESAAIVWEPAAKRQHFIRRATFHGQARDFGFLVPTPTVPELQEVDGGIFDVLAERTRREKRYETKHRPDFTPLLGYFVASKSETAGTNAGVNVLSTQNLAGYEAAVLEATDAAALHGWLRDHGYATTPDLEEWLDAYVKQGWKITAFKIDKEQGAIARSPAVKMSFAAERPFFPYREPRSQRDGSVPAPGRILRVWFLGPERVSGTVGGAAWNTELLWSSDPGAAWLRDFERRARVELPDALRLSAFADYMSPRPGTDDLFFDRFPLPPSQAAEY
ncbi:MAG TPA: DUF2330 domain-containing protein [Thermoanaerobaculia bacterium]|nr:DUF2330 domain-containing protein [Thermoanaerobaculia bacterium]